MLEGTYPHLRKFELIAQFFTQLKDITNLQVETLKTEAEDNNTTSRPIQKNRRVNYIEPKEKKPRSVIKEIRPSDVILMEQNKKTIDQLVQDNNILHGGIQDCLLVIQSLKNLAKKDDLSDFKFQIEQLQRQLTYCQSQIKIKDDQISQFKQKYKLLLQQLEQYQFEYQKDWDDQSKLLQELEVENQYLRKLLSLQFSDEQIKAIEQQQLNEELIFYDNFCISRKELDLKILEFDKTLGQRKQAYEQKYMNQIQYMSKNSAVYQDFEDNEKEEREMAMKKQKSVSQEEKHRILEELLKPIGGTKVDSSQFVQTSAEAKQKQMEILNQTPQKKEVKQKLAIEIDVSNKDSIEDQKIITLDEYDEDIKQEPQKKSSQKELMNSLEQGWQKLLSVKQKQQPKQRYDEEEEYGTQLQIFVLQTLRFQQQKPTFYDQDYYDDDDDEDFYKTIMDQQKQSKLSKTQKNQELQYQI